MRSPLFLAVALYCVAVAVAVAGQQHTCVHGSREDKVVGIQRPSYLRRIDAISKTLVMFREICYTDLTPGVRLAGTEHHVKRLAQQPIRFYTFPDSTISTDIPASKREMIMEDVVPSLLRSLSNTLSVSPAQGPILLDRLCDGSYYLPEDGSTVRQCVNTCTTPLCGTVTIPDNHLKRCIQCNGQQPPNCTPGNPSTDGAGVSDVDYILYISANQNAIGCHTPSIVAFAGACQMESTLDRPIAGYINFCPNSLKEMTRDFLYDVAKHELLHALAFSFSLFPFWRDSSGNVRTPRKGDGLPPMDPTAKMYMVDSNTVTSINYTNWRTITGPITHTVTVLVTEAVLREGKQHFGCEDLEGVELENQGGEGTALHHWEKRVLGNEAMTGLFDFNPVFSRLSLAVLEDSGWYTVSYSAAEPLVWGRGKGCGFITQGCGDMLNASTVESNPFCDAGEMEVNDGLFGCTLDRGSVAKCNLVELDFDIIPDYMYLSGNYGGRLNISDYCPYYRQFRYPSGRTGNCTDPLNQPSDATVGLYIGEDIYAETYGDKSRCIRQGRSWMKSYSTGGSTTTIRNQLQQYGGGCYEVKCSATEGVVVYVRGFPFPCGCEGEEHLVDITDCTDFTFKGSIVCPACAAVCGNNCPATVPDPCYTKVVEGSVQLKRENCPTDSTGTIGSGGAASLSKTTTLVSLAPLLALLSRTNIC